VPLCEPVAIRLRLVPAARHHQRCHGPACLNIGRSLGDNWFTQRTSFNHHISLWQPSDFPLATCSAKLNFSAELCPATHSLTASGAWTWTPNALQQMENACRLPVCRRAAHADTMSATACPSRRARHRQRCYRTRGRGTLPAASNSPCSICATRSTAVKPISVRAIEAETASTSAGNSNIGRTHPVRTKTGRSAPSPAFPRQGAAQLGTSGSGNHFVEFGEFTGGTRTRP